jgi:hypothetical protein
MPDNYHVIPAEVRCHSVKRVPPDIRAGNTSWTCQGRGSYRRVEVPLRS